MGKISESKVIAEDIRRISEGILDISQDFSGKTVLISGGAGFLGKYFVLTFDYLNKHVLKEPCKVIIIDNFITGLKEDIEENENIVLLEHDISKKIDIEGKVDFIIHAASLASPVFYNKYRLETIEVGYQGTKNLLEMAKDKEIESFLFMSSSEVYGNPDSKYIPTNEEYNGNVSCTGPRACYDEPKRIGETLCMTYADIYNIPVKIARPFNVFGPGMRLDDGRVVSNFVVAALKGEKIPVYGGGSNTRTFCYITDAIVGFMKMLASKHNRESFNIGSDEHEIEIRHLAQIVSGLVENDASSIKDVLGPTEVYKSADPNRRCPDLTKIRTLLNYKPEVSLIQGVKRFISWVKEEMYFQETKGSSSGEQTECRACGNKALVNIVDLGSSPLANNLLPNGENPEKYESFPLGLNYCPKCNLCQLSYVTPPEKMFKNYLYVTSTTQTFREHFGNFAMDTVSRFNMDGNSFVIDVGSNDGLLLKKFKERGVNVLGIDPAENVCEIARRDGVDTVCGFFNSSVAKEIVEKRGKADVVTANNVFAHVSDIKSFTDNVKKIIKDDGVFIIEVQYLLDTITKLTFDNIYHEHLSYFSVLSLNEFFNKEGMKIFDVEHVGTHGGSIRVFVQKGGGTRPTNKSVYEFIQMEKSAGLDSMEVYGGFGRKIGEIKRKLRAFLNKAKLEGKTVVGYGAPAKATTLLNFCELGREHIKYIVEDNPLKHGKIIPGTGIPIKGKSELEIETPDYILILAWNFAEEILKNNVDYHRKGATFVLPLPEPQALNVSKFLEN